MTADYTLCYNTEDGKLYIGRNCGEEKERFVGQITSEIAEIAGYTGKGNVLYLKNFTFATSASLALAVPGGTKIVFEGENSLSVINDQEDANVGVLYSSGDLTLEGGSDDTLTIHAETRQGLWSRAVCARAGDLTVNGGKITANSSGAKKSCGLYAGGRLWIEIGEKGKITISGGHVSVTAGKNAVRAAEGRLIIPAGAKVSNAQEFVGGEAFVGDCLSPIREEDPLIVSFLF